MLKYPTVSEIININKSIIEFHKETKAEKFELLGIKSDIQIIIQKTKTKKGDVHAKASVLLEEINRKHLFASGNKRTSFVVARMFIANNQGSITKKSQKEMRFLSKIRKGQATKGEIEEWLKK